MGVSVSHPLRRTTKTKYIQTFDGGSSEFDGTEQFFSHSLYQENNKEETSRGSKGFSNRNEAGCLQFKGTRGNSRCPFDSLDTIDSRKSVPFAVLPDNNTQALTRSPKGDGAFSVYSDGETTSVEKSGKVLFLDDVEDDLEDESSAWKCEAKLKEKNTPKPAGKLREKDRASSRTRSGEEVHLRDGNHGNSTRSRQSAENRSNMSVTHKMCADGRASEQEITRMIRANNETEMIYQKKLSPRQTS